MVSPYQILREYYRRRCPSSPCLPRLGVGSPVPLHQCARPPLLDGNRMSYSSLFLNACLKRKALDVWNKSLVCLIVNYYFSFSQNPTDRCQIKVDCHRVFPHLINLGIYFGSTDRKWLHSQSEKLLYFIHQKKKKSSSLGPFSPMHNQISHVKSVPTLFLNIRTLNPANRSSKVCFCIS